MKSIIRNIFINSLSLFLTSVVFPGLLIEDMLLTVVLAGTFLTIINLTVKPLLSLVTLPLNFLTLGGFSWIINIAIIYLLIILLPNIKIVNFTFPGTDVLGFVIPRIDFTMLTGLIAVSLMVTFITNVIKWLIR